MGGGEGPSGIDLKTRRLFTRRPTTIQGLVLERTEGSLHVVGLLVGCGHMYDVHITAQLHNQQASFKRAHQHKNHTLLQFSSIHLVGSPIRYAGVLVFM